MVIEVGLPVLLWLAALYFLFGASEERRQIAWTRFGVPIFVVLHLAYPVLVWTLLPEPRSDMWVWEGSTSRLFRGIDPSLPPLNLYGPALPALQGIGRWFTPGQHPVGTLWIFAVGNALTVFLGARLAGRVLGPSAEAKVGLWLLLDPLLWHQLAVRAQDESLFLGTLVAAAYLLERRQVAAAAFMLAFGLCATKVTYAPYAGAVLLAMTSDRGFWKGWVVFVVVVAAVHAVYAATGGPVFFDRTSGVHSQQWGVGPSLMDAAARVFPGTPKALALAVYGLGTVWAVLWVWHRSWGVESWRRACLLVATAHAASLLLMPFSVSPYPAQGLAFAVILLLPRGRVGMVLLALLSLDCVLTWTGSRFFSLPMKPLNLAVQGLSLYAVWLATRSPRRGT